VSARLSIAFLDFFWSSGNWLWPIQRSSSNKQCSFSNISPKILISKTKNQDNDREVLSVKSLVL